MESIAIFGAGGHGREVLMLIDHINRDAVRWKVEGFFDDGVPRGSDINGVKVLGGLAELNRYERPLALAMAIGSSDTKKKVIGGIANDNVWFPNLIHPSVHLPATEYLRLGKGLTVFPGVIIGPNVEIADHVLLNFSVLVGHDARIGAYASIMPSVSISGEVNIGAGVYVGVGTSIINRVDIGENTVVAAGSVVFNSLPANCTAMGMPARSVRKNDA
jgi:sugar O-acyltransferase (sialic acid O-acetyltransferase NeuD family)